MSMSCYVIAFVSKYFPVNFQVQQEHQPENLSGTVLSYLEISSANLKDVPSPYCTSVS